MADVILLASKGSTNFVSYEDRIYAVPQSLGPCNDTTWSNPAVQSFGTLEAAMVAFPDNAPAAATPAPAQSGHRTLRELEGGLFKVVAVYSDEIEWQDGGPGWLYLFRDNDGSKFMWGPNRQRYEFHRVDTVAEADHVDFLCPACFAKNGGAKGTHGVMVSFAGRNIPDDAGTRDATGKPSRWNVSGSGLDDLVLTPSILLDAGQPPDRGCHWHGYVGSNGIPPGHAG